jgi:ATP-dependent DNA helicase RecQ
MDVMSVLRARFGFDSLKPGQAQVVDAILQRGAAMAVFPTGGGKSLCYQLPALLLDGVTVVVSPLIALMKDQIDFLRARGVAAARLDSTLTADEVRRVNGDVRAGRVSLLYVAPERFSNERFLEVLGGSPIALFAVDEAHCISEWGHNFRPDYLKLAEVRKRIGAKRVLALTATATPSVVEDVCRAFDIPAADAIVTGFYRDNLDLFTTAVSHRERDALLATRLAQREGPGIVYVTLQKTAERVAEELGRAGIPARPYHAGMKPEERAAVQDWWMASGDAVVVATIAFGMGIDKADVRHVTHYNLPKSLESYSQEIGRAGRDGKRSRVELLACSADVPVLESFAYGDTPSPRSVRGLVEDVLGRGKSFAISLFDLSNQHDVRMIVARTALTYLELSGVLVQGTPFYAAYEVRPLLPVPEIAAKLPEGEKRTFVEDIFRHAKKKKIWHSVDPAVVGEQLGQPADRIVKAIGYLEEQGWIEVQASELRLPFRRQQDDDDAVAIASELLRRFEKREAGEIARIRQVLSLVSHEGCQTNALVAHFGEQRATPCGHCTFCRTGKPTVLPPLPTMPPIESLIDSAVLRSLRAEHTAALGEPRQAARFLCGISSPAISRARLGRHPLAGALAELPFADVLAFCEASG